MSTRPRPLASACTVAILIQASLKGGPTVALSRDIAAGPRSLIQVDLSFERSSSSRRARREIDSVDRHHRKRSSGSSEPTSSVLDRRNFRNPGGIWWNEDTFTNKCARQLVAIRRSEA